jgi:stringent starvation protein B
MDTTNRLIVLSKKDHFLRLMEQTGVARVAVDGRLRGVELPAQFIHQAEVSLVFTKQDVNVTAGAEALTATLKFGGKPFAVKLPWNAVFLVADEKGDGLLWEDDAPLLVVERLSKSGLLSSKVSGPLDSTNFRVIDMPFKTTQVS